MDEKINSRLSFILRSSILFAVIFVLLGAGLYLLENAHKQLPTGTFSEPGPIYTQFSALLSGLWHFEPSALMLFGFLILVAAQIMRVLVLGLYLMKKREYGLALCSFLIFGVLVFSLGA